MQLRLKRWESLRAVVSGETAAATTTKIVERVPVARTMARILHMNRRTSEIHCEDDWKYGGHAWLINSERICDGSQMLIPGRRKFKA